MSLVLFLFYLVLLPRETHVCSLWVSQPPSSVEVAEACGRLDLEQYTVQLVNIHNQVVWCEKPASIIYAPVDACDLKGISLDNFRMNIYRQDGEQALCSITTANQTGPELYELRTACPPEAVESYLGGQAAIRFVREIQPAPPPEMLTIPAPEYGPGLFDQPPSPDDLHTDIAYTWLAGRLIWHGYVIPDCDGYSGLDPVLAANGCGMASARASVRAWQNQFDADIHAAALVHGVPARLLKRIIAIESQFWPYYDGPAGEIGLAQVTRAAADQYLRIFQPGYYQLSPQTREMLQAGIINGLRCDYCAVPKSIEQEKRNIDMYARMLKAYRATSGDWYGALVAWNGEDYASRVMQ